MQLYKRNKRRMIEAYYGYTTGINDVDIREILEHSPNIQKGIIFVFSVVFEINSVRSVKFLLRMETC